VTVGNLTGVAATAAGEQHSLAVKSDGTVWTWGANGSGQLGDGTTTASSTPHQTELPFQCRWNVASLSTS